MALDQLDSRIITALIDDARSTYAEIGSRVGLSASAVKRRVDRLLATGVITGFSASVEPAALGWGTEAFVELYCVGRTAPSEIRAALAKFPEVVSASTVTGDADAVVHLLAADVQHFEQVLERIAAEPFVVRSKSSVVLSRLVRRNGTAWQGVDTQ
ncbi:Lrp/AsnC family transcriptional regulator [Embleya sp. AB8]|uniref:Lrp/AsnC family transcriptional regulator n=1 Tax=Embleya sp. AB8 TaxID=3156304 RepID=UPI003C71BC02